MDELSRHGIKLFHAIVGALAADKNRGREDFKNLQDNEDVSAADRAVCEMAIYIRSPKRQGVDRADCDLPADGFRFYPVKK